MTPKGNAKKSIDGNVKKFKLLLYFRYIKMQFLISNSEKDEKPRQKQNQKCYTNLSQDNFIFFQFYLFCKR